MKKWSDGLPYRQITNEDKGIQLVNGETTSKKFDKRPMGVRLWKVDKKNEMDHAFMKLEGISETTTESTDTQMNQR